MMVEAVVEEPLVLLVKLADRLHNMRTVYALPPSKQVAVAEETLEVWCSMAAYLGWYGLKVSPLGSSQGAFPYLSFPLRLLHESLHASKCLSTLGAARERGPVHEWCEPSLDNGVATV
jgi:hypothetical protein